MTELTIVMVHLRAQSFHKTKDAFFGLLSVRQLLKIGVNFRRTGSSELFQSDIEFFNRIVTGTLAEQNIEELTISNKLIILFLFPFSRNGIT